jgi:hypothetical protein
MHAESSPSSPPLRDAPTRGAAFWRLATAASAVLFLLVHLELTVKRPDRALFTFDSAEYAIAGRELARTGRLGTTFVLPDELGATSRLGLPRVPPFPLLVGHPLVPILNGAVFALAGPRPELTLVPSGVAYVMVVLLAGALAARLSGSPATGLAAALATAASPHLLYFAVEGLTELPFAAALLGGLLLSRRLDEPRVPLLLGVVLGIGHMARPIMAPLLPVWLVAVVLAVPRGRRLRAAGGLALGFVPFAAALGAYKWITAGHPLADVARYNFLTHLAPEFAPIRVHRMLQPPAPMPWMLEHPGAVLAKIARFLPDLGGHAFAQAGALGAVALATLFWPAANAGEGRVRRILLGLAAMMILLVTLSLPSRRYLVPLLPALFAVGVAALAVAARRIGLPRLPAVGLCFAAALFVSGVPTLRDWRWAWRVPKPDRGEFRESEWRGFGAELAPHVPPGAIVASDVGSWLAWYADRPAVLLPNRPEDLPELERHLAVTTLVLTNEWLLRQSGSEAWQRIYEGTDSLPGWRRRAALHVGHLRAVVLERQQDAVLLPPDRSAPSAPRPHRANISRAHSPSRAIRSRARARREPSNGASSRLRSRETPMARA